MKRLTVLALALLLLLTACAGEAEPVEEEWADYQHSLAQDQEDPDVEDQGEETVELPTELSLAYYKSATLDPITCSENVQLEVSELLYEPLYRLDDSFSPTPVLCQSASWDETGTVCTLNLRQNVRFSDGSDLTAQDVAATLLRAAQSDRYGYRLRNMVSAAANKDGQVVVTLTSPNTGFLSLLDIPVVKSGTEGDLVPVGTGPYVFAETDGSASLQANPDWWQGKTLPVQTIPLVAAKDLDAAVSLFSSRRVELLTVDPTGDQIAVSGSSQETARPTTTMQFIGFNTLSGVFSQPALRAIFSRGLRRDMLSGVFLSGHAVSAQFPIAPQSSLYPADLEQSYTSDETLEALTQAGQNTGETVVLRLLVNEEDGFRLTSAEYIAQTLSLGDWDIQVVSLPWEEYLLALESGDFDLYYGEVRLTADWDLTGLIGTGGALNYGGYANGRTDELMAALSSSDDRQAAAHALALHLQTTAPIAPICFKQSTVLTHPDVVENLSPTASGTFAGLTGWRVHLST
jgi:peptide/nickel transport system substrate-binding protein